MPHPSILLLTCLEHLLTLPHLLFLHNSLLGECGRKSEDASQRDMEWKQQQAEESSTEYASKYKRIQVTRREQIPQGTPANPSKAGALVSFPTVINTDQSNGGNWVYFSLQFMSHPGGSEGRV